MLILVTFQFNIKSINMYLIIFSIILTIFMHFCIKYQVKFNDYILFNFKFFSTLFKFKKIHLKI